MKISCLKFSSRAVLQEYVHYIYPFVVEDMDNILCGMFTESEIGVAVRHFHASLLTTSSNTTSAKDDQ